MKLVKTKEELRNELELIRTKSEIGLVPTMGALHKGHLSLVKQAVLENKVVVVSVFVNPTQFNDANDLKHYPRNLNADLELLSQAGCDFVFSPEPEEMYPEPDNRVFDFGSLDKVMEGRFRPGHFNGVAQIVSKLFKLVEPDRAYFGQKDFQQLAIVKKLVNILNFKIDIVACPIVREESGLALSSRNALLSKEEKENATFIYKTLIEAKKLKNKKSVKDIEKWVIETVNDNKFLEVEYFEIVNSETLERINNWNEKGEKTACIAVYCGKVRLIDNIVFN